MARRGSNEGSIRERSDGRWEARVVVTTADGRRVRRSLLGRDRAAVRDKLQAALQAESHGIATPDQRLTVGPYLAQWLEETVRPKLRPRTYTSYAGTVQVHLVPGLGTSRSRGCRPSRSSGS